MDDVLAVAQHLHFHVAGALEEALQIERAAAERGLGFGLRGVKLMFEARLVVRRRECRGRHHRRLP